MADFIADAFAFNKLACSLSSNIPVEVEWAYNVLAAVSYTEPQRITLSECPSIGRALEQHIREYFQQDQDDGDDDESNEEEVQSQFGID